MDSGEREYAVGDDAEDWEYVYDPTEKETFYVTLDLPPAPGDDGNKEENYFFHSRLRRPILKEKDSDGTHANGSHLVPRNTGDASSENTVSQPQEKDADTTFQILDVNSPEPLVSYKDHVFRCSWHTGLGTDLLFSAPDIKPEGVDPLIEDPKFNLLAATNIKLVGHALELGEKPYQDLQSRNRALVLEQQTADPQLTSQGSFGSNRPSAVEVPPKRHKIPLEESAGASRKTQASFLEDLMAAKAARDGTSDVYLGKGKKYMIEDNSEPRSGQQAATSTRKVREEVLQQEEMAGATPKRRRPYTRRAGKSSRGGRLSRNNVLAEPRTRELFPEFTPQPLPPNLRFNGSTPGNVAKDSRTMIGPSIDITDPVEPASLAPDRSEQEPGSLTEANTANMDPLENVDGV